MTKEIPAPQFERLERVLISGEGPRCGEYHGERGTIVWLDSYAVWQNPARPDQWMYLVHLSARGSYKTFFQSDLESEGVFDPASAHLGTRPEISFDTVLKADNNYTAGSFRLPGEFWKVVIFRAYPKTQLRTWKTLKN